MSNNPYIDQMKLPSSKPARRRKIVTKSDKKIADDEFMAAAIGDVEWLRQSLRDARGKINYDKNVRGENEEKGFYIVLKWQKDMRF